MANIRFQLLRATKIEWSTKNPILRSGEPGIESDTARLKLGDGSTTWDNLEYIGDDIYNETILATVNLGDIKAGDTIEGKKVTELLKSILSAYIKPTFTSFTANTKTSINLEIGVPLLSAYNLTWNLSNLSNVQDTTSGIISCDDINAFNNLGNVNLKDLSLNLNSVSGYTYNTPDKISLTITGQDIKGSNIGNKKIDFNWLSEVRYGVKSASGITTQNGIDTLGTSFLSDKNGLVKTYPFNIGYPFISVPEYIDVSDIKFIDAENGLKFSMAAQNIWDNTLPELVQYNNGNTTYNCRIFRGEFYYNAPTSVKIEF